MAKLCIKIFSHLLNSQLTEKGLQELSNRSSVVNRDDDIDHKIDEFCDYLTKSFKGVTIWTLPLWLMWFITLPVQLVIQKMCNYSWVKRTTSRLVNASVDAVVYTYREGPTWFFQVLSWIVADFRAIPSFVMALVCGVWASIIGPHFRINVMIRLFILLCIFIVATLKSCSKLKFGNVLMMWWFIGNASLKYPIFLLYVIVPLILHKTVRLTGFTSTTCILTILQLALL
jgi:hypothetical protein